MAPGPDTDDRPAERASAAGRVLAVASVAPALAFGGWLCAAIPLLALGWLHPLPAVLLGIPAAAAAVWCGCRRLQVGPSPWWPVVTLILVAGAFTGLSAATHAEQVVLRRDPGAYALIGQWVGEHGGKSVPTDAAAFGAAAEDVGFASPAFFRDGDDALRPQFMSGMPATLAIGWWLGGWTGLLVVPAVCGGLALLAFGGLAARLIGPRWAPLAALVLGAAQPVLHVARSTYSEPLAQLLLLGGLCLVVSALTDRVAPAAVRASALAGGALLGVATVVRVDALREILLAIPVAGVLAAYRHPAARPLAIGLAGGLVFGVADGLLLTWPYVSSIGGSLVPLLAGGAVLAGITAFVVRRIRRRPEGPRHLPHRVPTLAAGAVAVVGVLLALRPLFWESRTDPMSPGARTVAGIQLRNGLTVDGGRNYYEQTVSWVSWYVGWPALALALGAAVLLTRRALRGEAPAWGALLVIGGGSAALTFLRPEITPDHPWADRRLVPVLLPFVVLLAVAAVAELTKLVRARAAAAGERRAYAAVFATVAVGALLLLVPPVVASSPLMGERTEQGELAAVRAVCRALEPGDVVLLADRRAQLEWAPAVRNICGVPVASLPRRRTDAPVSALPQPTAVEVAAAVRAAGGNPVLLTAQSSNPIGAVGGDAEQIVRLRTREDARLLTRRPERTAPLPVDVWLGHVPPER